MMTGLISADREAKIRLSVKGGNDGEIEIEAVMDTDFNGALTLPLDIIHSLQLQRRAPRQATLADGSVTSLDTFQRYFTGDGDLEWRIASYSCARR